MGVEICQVRIAMHTPGAVRGLPPFSKARAGSHLAVPAGLTCGPLLGNFTPQRGEPPPHLPTAFAIDRGSEKVARYLRSAAENTEVEVYLICSGKENNLNVFCGGWEQNLGKPMSTLV